MTRAGGIPANSTAPSAALSGAVRGNPLGCSSREGFTLIELMVVTLILGILAAVMAPRLNEARDRAHFASIRSDLRNMGASQERYHQTGYSYANSLASLDFSPSPGVTIEVTEASPAGWAAVASHAALDEDRGCAIYLGNALPPPLPDGGGLTSGPGTVECTN